eukprot:scaffold64754_cov33-Tisochrysis_lutea.AAC.5
MLRHNQRAFGKVLHAPRDCHLVPELKSCAYNLSTSTARVCSQSRIRQKGKSVALCSMRNCCARDLVRHLTCSSDSSHHLLR